MHFGCFIFVFKSTCGLTIKNRQDALCRRRTARSPGQKDMERVMYHVSLLVIYIISLIYLNSLAHVDIEQDRNRIDGKCSN